MAEENIKDITELEEGDVLHAKHIKDIVESIYWNEFPTTQGGTEQ